LKANPIDECSPDKERGKNPRQLHLHIDGIGALEFFPHERFFISRKLLETLLAQPIRIEGKALRNLINWVANRYTRSAFPDSFNERVRTINKKLQRLIEKHIESVLGLFIGIFPDEEVAKEQTYKIRVVLLT